MDMITKNDFVEIKYTGYSNGNIFDSNVEENIKKINPKESAKETIVIVGQGMLVPGLDNALEGKEIGKDYEVEVKSKDGFGDRKANLLKTIPLKVFLEKKMMPQPGMVFAMDDKLAKIVTVSGARVITDFNNPLAGKDLKYEFKIVRKVSEENEKVKVVLGYLFRFAPEFEIKDKVVVKGPKGFEVFVNAFNKKFKELIGKDLAYEEKVVEKKEETKE